jgi:hypothetical protein
VVAFRFCPLASSFLRQRCARGVLAVRRWRTNAARAREHKTSARSLSDLLLPHKPHSVDQDAHAHHTSTHSPYRDDDHARRERKTHNRPHHPPPHRPISSQALSRIYAPVRTRALSSAWRPRITSEKREREREANASNETPSPSSSSSSSACVVSPSARLASQSQPPRRRAGPRGGRDSSPPQVDEGWVRGIV